MEKLKNGERFIVAYQPNNSSRLYRYWLLTWRDGLGKCAIFIDEFTGLYDASDYIGPIAKWIIKLK